VRPRRTAGLDARSARPASWETDGCLRTRIGGERQDATSSGSHLARGSLR
jgi:hypothetical protein